MAEAGPLVVACLAPSDPRPEIDPLSGAVHADPRRAELAPSDAAALEHALRAGGAWGGRVVAVAAGPPSVDAALREAVASGAAALRVPWSFGDDDGSAGPVAVSAAELAGDPETLARALATAIMGLGSHALVVCGDRSALRGTGAVPAFLAHHLGAQQALGLVSLRADGGTLAGERRLDGGWRQRLRISAPAVVSVEAAGVRLRRASLAATLAATEAVIPVAAPGPVPAHPSWLRVGAAQPYRPRTKVIPPPQGPTHERLLSLTGALNAHDPPRIVGPVDADTAAGELLDYLARHGYRPASADTKG
jgi:electron transfer flavoprotein beta subunit